MAFAIENSRAHGVLAERIFGVANFLPVLPSADTRVYLKKNFRLKYLALIAQWYSVRLACEGTPDRSPPELDFAKQISASSHNIQAASIPWMKRKNKSCLDIEFHGQRS